MSIDKENYKQLIKAVAGGENITSGIHNYCDRWCERCTHTAKCSVFRIEQEMNISNEALDIQNEQFWQSLSTIFKATIELLHEKMQELDLNIEVGANLVEEDKDFITKSLSNDMVIKSKSYAFDVIKWLDLHRDLIFKRYEMQQKINETNALLIADSVEVIQHYFMLIATKTYRASLVYDNDDTDDARGSAKVTLIIIDRSIAAWSALLTHFTSMEDDILHFLKALTIIKRLILEAFPTAMEFVRPGFDE
jgi:hypothetical protein